MDLELAGKTAIVTGGSRGIGKAIARELAHEGVDVAIVARSADALEAAAAELAEETGRVIVPIVADTGSDASVKAMVEQAAKALGHIDILVNCAAQPGGQGRPPVLAEITDEVFWPDINVKVMGYLRCIREVVPHMARRGGGRIVNVSGLAARSTGSTVGSVRNVAVAAMTKNLAEELGPQGISVVVVHPALTRTEKTPGVIRARAMVTRRLRPLQVEGRTVHQVGLPWHWGYRGLVTGDVANDLTAISEDPNSRIMESKALLCDIAPSERNAHGIAE